MTKSKKARIRKMLKVTQGKWRARHFQTGEIVYGRWSDLCDLDNRLWVLTVIEDEAPRTPVRSVMPDEIYQPDYGPCIAWVDCVFDTGEMDEETGKYVPDWTLYKQGIDHWTDLVGKYIGELA